MQRLTAAAALLCLALPAMAHEDGQWIADAQLRNEMGQLCCGARDCERIPKGGLAVTSAGYRIKSRGETVPYSRALPASPDGDWMCVWGGELKCLIVPPSGS